MLLLISVAGASQVRVNAGLYDDITSRDEFSRTLSFFERHFGGIRSVDLLLTPGDSAQSQLEDRVMAETEHLHHFMRDTYGVHQITDVTVLVKRMARSLTAGDPEAWDIPADSSRMNVIRFLFSREFHHLGLSEWLSRDFRMARLAGRMKDVGSWEVARKSEQLEAFVRDSIDSDLLHIRLTGIPYLLDKTNEDISRKLFAGLLFAIALVSLLMGLMYRSWFMVLVAILPNVLPLLLILGLIGWLDIGMKMSTAVTFTIAFGIAVDDTIHMMSMLRKELASGKTAVQAIRRCFGITGRAIVVTSVILVCGFGILLFSSFYSSFLTGLLISVALLLALFSDLLLLPAMLLTIKKEAVSKGAGS